MTMGKIQEVAVLKNADKSCAEAMSRRFAKMEEEVENWVALLERRRIQQRGLSPPPDSSHRPIHDPCGS
jgi:hypothetical protein